MQLGDAMARRSWHGENLASQIGAEPAEVRSWLLGEELPGLMVLSRLSWLLFDPDSLVLAAFLCAYSRAQGWNVPAV
jgi:hypothetical protein